MSTRQEGAGGRREQEGAGGRREQEAGVASRKRRRRRRRRKKHGAHKIKTHAPHHPARAQQQSVRQSNERVRRAGECAGRESAHLGVGDGELADGESAETT